MRSLKWTTFIVAPSLNGINKRVRETHVSFLCLVPSHPVLRGYGTRGCVQIYRKVPKDWGKESYWKLEATTLYPKLTAKHQREYDAIKREHQMKLLRKFIGDGEEEE